MEVIGKGMQADTSAGYVLMLIELLLLFIGTGTICRCILIALKALEKDTEIHELKKVLINRVIAAIMALCAAGVLEAVERAFKK